MAFHDNRMWLLSHIHNSFVSSDDTGICEMVLSPETFKQDMTVIAKENVSALINSFNNSYDNLTYGL